MKGRVGMPGRDAGETLVELIVSIAILGVIGVALASGIAVSVLVSDVHRKQTLASNYLHSYAEALQTSNTYVSCSGGTPNYLSPLRVTPPSGFNLPTEQIAYWNGASFQSGCPNTGDHGLQQITLAVSSTDGRSNESLVVAVRQS